MVGSMSAVRGLGGEPAQEGKYRVLVELGQGGTAIVYLAVARGPSGFNKLVVLKALKKNLASDPEFRNMFLNEARLAARLNHPNIVQTNEVADDEGELRYMPPGQISGEAIDRRADRYAVGVMVWEAAAGERVGKGHSDATIMN